MKKAAKKSAKKMPTKRPVAMRGRKGYQDGGEVKGKYKGATKTDGTTHQAGSGLSKRDRRKMLEAQLKADGG